MEQTFRKTKIKVYSLGVCIFFETRPSYKILYENHFWSIPSATYTSTFVLTAYS